MPRAWGEDEGLREIRQGPEGEGGGVPPGAPPRQLEGERGVPGIVGRQKEDFLFGGFRRRRERDGDGGLVNGGNEQGKSRGVGDREVGPEAERVEDLAFGRAEVLDGQDEVSRLTDKCIGVGVVRGARNKEDSGR